MSIWKIAGVQMDCRIGDKAHNLSVMCARLREAAALGARLVIFPECALSGYCFESREEAVPFAETIPGPASEALACDCRELGVWAAFGLLELDLVDAALYNSCCLVGPSGATLSYRKIHLPFLGVDRFTRPGNRPFAVHDLGGLRVGMNICYDSSFPESSRALMLMGADLVILPTNWPTGARSTVNFVVQTRALENRVYYAAVNRVGTERGFEFIGQSRLIDVDGEILKAASEGEEILLAEIDPIKARTKKLVKIPGKYELDRVADRRPEMYARITEPEA